jgi:hypothetical protein
MASEFGPSFASEPVVMWRMQRSGGLSAHLVIGCDGNAAWAAWFLNDGAIGVRDFDDIGSAIEFSTRMQAQNWSVGWRLVGDPDGA